MRVPLSWLREYVDVDLPPRELAAELTMRGMEVSDIEVGGGDDWREVVVGRVLEVERHPNADTLWLTRVGSDGAAKVTSGLSAVGPPPVTSSSHAPWKEKTADEPP